MDTITNNTTKHTEFNGHPSWNFWNVSQWINNDEPLYQRAVYLIETKGLEESTLILHHELIDLKTPDGAPYSRASIHHTLSDL